MYVEIKNKMPKFPLKIIFAILLSPVLTTPLAAMEIVDDAKALISETIDEVVNHIQPKEKSEAEQLEADAQEKLAVEQSLTNAEQLANTASESNEITQESLQTKNKETQKKSSPIHQLVNTDHFKICSLGQKYDINNFEFSKQSQVTHAATIMKFSAGTNPNYKCEIMVMSEDKQDVSLKCWHGSKFNETISTLKLSHFFGQGFLFAKNSNLVLVKPVIQDQENNCPSDFQPVAGNEKSENIVKEDKDGLAGLTF